jgi:hypothetical protein
MASKNTKPFLILFQALLMLLAGWLVSHISWIGRVGINLMYKEYSIFKSWWKTALLFFAIQMVLLFLQNVVHKKYSRSVANIASIVLLTTALIGLFATYSDFNNNFSHRILKEKFHLGFYLFWLGWISTCLYYIFSPGRSEAAISKANSVT